MNNVAKDYYGIYMWMYVLYNGECLGEIVGKFIFTVSAEHKLFIY